MFVISLLLSGLVCLGSTLLPCPLTFILLIPPIPLQSVRLDRLLVRWRLEVACKS